jgi:hypothetical protein
VFDYLPVSKVEEFLVMLAATWRCLHYSSKLNDPSDVDVELFIISCKNSFINKVGYFVTFDQVAG